MVGNMFDNTLKARVDGLCAELAQLVSTTTVFPASSRQAQGGFATSNWWPADLGVPSSAGGQSDARYAVFPSTRRLATQNDGVTRVYDTGDHRIGGVQQQQGGRGGTVTFTSQLGTFDVSTLRELGARQAADTPAVAPPAPAPPRPTPTRRASTEAPSDMNRHHRGHRIAGGSPRPRDPLRRGVRHQEGRTARSAVGPGSHFSSDCWAGHNAMDMADGIGLSVGATALQAVAVGRSAVRRSPVLTLYPHRSSEVGVPSRVRQSRRARSDRDRLRRPRGRSGRHRRG